MRGYARGVARRLRRANRAQRANAWRNARGTPARTARWAPARDALWDVLEAWTPAGCVRRRGGRGNGDSVPLRRLAAQPAGLDLIDVDAAAAGRARARAGGGARVLVEDATGGAADRIVQAVWRGRDARDPLAPGSPIGEPPYDVVVADLFLSQVLYPALLDRGLEQDAIGAALRRYGDPLTASIVDRLHAAAPDGVVVHAHDPAGWWDGHPQPVRARGDPRRAGRRGRARARGALHAADRLRPARRRGGCGRRDLRDGALALAVPGRRRLPGLRDGGQALAVALEVAVALAVALRLGQERLALLGQRPRVEVRVGEQGGEADDGGEHDHTRSIGRAASGLEVARSASSSR